MSRRSMGSVRRQLVRACSAAVALLLVAGVALAGCQQSATPAPPPAPAAASAPSSQPPTYKFGVSMPFTGNAALYGEMTKAGVEMALEEINGAGGVKGRKMEAVYDDNQVEARLGATGLQKLVSVDKVPFVITAGTGILGAQLPIAQETNTVLYTGYTSAPQFAGKYKYLFMTVVPLADEVKAMSEYAVNGLGGRKVAIFYRGDELGFTIRDLAKKLLPTLGASVVVEETHELGATNFGAQAAKVKAAEPDILFVATYSKEALTFLKQARDVGIGAQAIGVSSWDTPEVLKDPATEGMIFTVQRFDEGASPRATEFFKKQRERYQWEPTLYQGNHYDAVYVLKDAIDYASSKGWDYSGSSIGNAIRDMKTLNSLMGKITLKDDGTVSRPIAVKKVSGGKGTILKYIEP